MELSDLPPNNFPVFEAILDFPSSTLLRRLPLCAQKMEVSTVDSDSRPTIMITNDDGIDAPGLRALVRVLVSTQLYNVLVCAPDSYASCLFSSSRSLLFPIFECFCLKLMIITYCNRGVYFSW